MSDRYVPMGYIDPNAPQPYYSLPATPPIPPNSSDPYGAYGAAVPLPYDPNAAPRLAPNPQPMPSNVITPMDPNKGKSLSEITPLLGWRGY